MTIQQYRYFSNHDDKVVALGPHEVECGMVNLKLQFRVGPGTGTNLQVQVGKGPVGADVS